MEKVLISDVYVPVELYVERDADRQLKELIAHTGRPGHVLVSRQMGKTNLLVNAKRKYQNEKVIISFFDLSTNIPSLEEFFENIVDSIIELNSQTFDSVKSVIEAIRRKAGKTTVISHKAELRALLKVVDKLVIILDEIDGLTKTSYSDEVFAQIRSVYFEKINFTEFEKLQYILSGVVEPKDIIKNPKISPFNISQRILLSDFTYTEFEQFLKKSKLTIAEDIVKRIFYWTNGQPRMTWDICSNIEDQINENIVITNEIVDKLVYSLYLKNFDSPPIDHIRDLVITNEDLRTALVELHYDKGNEIDEQTRSKLYLSGIINNIDGNIKFKNLIFEKGLTLNWLNDISENESEIFSEILKLGGRGDYEAVIKKLEITLQNSENLTKSELSVFYQQFGNALLNQGNIEKALVNLEKCSFTKLENGKIFNNNLLLKCICWLNLQMIIEFKNGLIEILSSEIYDDNYESAYVLYLFFKNIYIKELSTINPEQLRINVLENFTSSSSKRVIEEIHSVIDSLKEPKINSFNMEILNGNLKNYSIYYLKSLVFLNINTDSIEKSINNLIKKIEDLEFYPDLYNPFLNNEALFQELYYLAIIKNNVIIINSIHNSFNSKNFIRKKFLELVVRRFKDVDFTKKIFERNIDLTPEEKLNLIKILAESSQATTNNWIIYEYANLTFQINPVLNEQDFRLFIQILEHRFKVESKMVAKGSLDLLRLLFQFEGIKESQKFALHFIEMQIRYNIGDPISINSAKKIINSTFNQEFQNSKIIDKNFFNFAQKTAKSVLKVINNSLSNYISNE